MAEANRMPPVRRKLADAIKAGHRETFATRRGPASEFVMGRETEPMFEAPVDIINRQRESGRFGRKTGGAQECSWLMQSADLPVTAGQRSTLSVVVGRQNPHGVKSVPKTDKRILTEPRNFIVASHPCGRKMTEAISERSDEGRSPRSSPRTGKPFAWRRGAVNRACTQEVGECLTR